MERSTGPGPAIRTHRPIQSLRASGYRGAYIDRYDLPYDESPLQPEITVDDFKGLCDRFGV